MLTKLEPTSLLWKHIEYDGDKEEPSLYPSIPRVVMTLSDSFVPCKIDHLNNESERPSERFGLCFVLAMTKCYLTFNHVIGSIFDRTHYKQKQLPATVHAVGFFQIGHETYMSIPQLFRFHSSFYLPEDAPKLQFIHYMMIIADFALVQHYHGGMMLKYDSSDHAPIVPACYMSYPEPEPLQEHITILPQSHHKDDFMDSLIMGFLLSQKTEVVKHSFRYKFGEKHLR